jgi:tetratricopeptide (TPR) repeat protein
MERVRTLATISGIFAILLPTPLAAQTPDAEALKARGLELGYNLDYDQALAAFRAAIEANPNDSNAHRLAAATLWISTLFKQGAVTADDYLGQARSEITRQPVAPEVTATFQTHIDRALALAEERVRDHPTDADAHFQLGAAYGYLTTYRATVEGRVVGGFRTARRAYTENERALTLDPHRRDAGLKVGISRSTASTPRRDRRLRRRSRKGVASHRRGRRLSQ